MPSFTHPHVFLNPYDFLGSLSIQSKGSKVIWGVKCESDVTYGQVW